MTNSAKPKTDGSRYAQAGVMLALRDIRMVLAEDTGVTAERAAAIRRSVVGDESSYDFDSALELIVIAPEVVHEPDSSLSTACRRALRAIVATTNVSWSALVTNGTAVLRDSLRASARNVLQCFEYGHLFDEDDSANAWWDAMEALVRAREDAIKAESGRQGEGLSMKHEQRRLSDEGRADLEPVWIARRDTYAGYDIESYDVSTGEVRKIYIECKACKQPPLSFHLSPNEVRMASNRRDSFFIHLWNLATEEMTLIRTDDIQEHLPKNNGAGKWQDVRITWTTRTS